MQFTPQQQLLNNLPLTSSPCYSLAIHPTTTSTKQFVTNVQPLFLQQLALSAVLMVMPSIGRCQLQYFYSLGASPSDRQ